MTDNREAALVLLAQPRGGSDWPTISSILVTPTGSTRTRQRSDWLREVVPASSCRRRGASARCGVCRRLRARGEGDRASVNWRAAVVAVRRSGTSARETGSAACARSETGRARPRPCWRALIDAVHDRDRTISNWRAPLLIGGEAEEQQERDAIAEVLGGPDLSLIRRRDAPGAGRALGTFQAGCANAIESLKILLGSAKSLDARLLR